MSPKALEITHAVGQVDEERKETTPRWSMFVRRGEGARRAHVRGMSVDRQEPQASSSNGLGPYRLDA
jgi:hypothetical protein